MNPSTPDPTSDSTSDPLLAELADLPSGRLRALLAPVCRQFSSRPAAQEPSPSPGSPGSPGSSLPLLAWAEHYLPDHFTLPPSPMHRWLAAQLDRMRHERGSKLNLLGPRASAKSTIATLAWPLRCALEKTEPYIWIISDTKHQAQAHLDNLKAELANNARLALAYPDSVGPGPVWRAGAIVLRNGVAVEAFGTGQRIRGRRRGHNRPTLILCDDLQNDSHTESALQRDHSRSWFHGTLLKAGTPATNVVNLATALHVEALALELHRTPGWTSAIFRAIHEWPENATLWREWETIYADPENPEAAAAARQFYEAHRADMDSGASVLWPEMEDLYALMSIRAESGRTAFEREKQNSPINPDLCEWPEDYFGEDIWFDDWPAQPIVKVLTLDPSKGADARRGDFSAFVRLGLDRQGIVYIEADLARRPAPRIVADGVEHYRAFQPDAFGIEANLYQDLFASQFEAEFHRQGLLRVRPWLVNNQVNKLVRIRRLGPHLAARRLRFCSASPSTRLLVDQLKQFPLADHDDGPDALEMAVRLAAQLLARPYVDTLGSRISLVSFV